MRFLLFLGVNPARGGWGVITVATLLANNGRLVCDTNILRPVFHGELLGKVQEVARFAFTIAELEIRLCRKPPSGNVRVPLC